MSATVSDLSAFLVEPSPTQAKIIVGHLNDLGVQKVHTFNRGADAIAQLREHRPGIVFSSMYLPDMTGTDLVVAIRHDEELANVPFVLISSETRPHVLDPVRQSGVCAIVPKPFTRQLLDAALHTAFDTLTVDDTLEEAGVPLEDLKVLVVDDSALARRFIRQVLVNLGIRNIEEAVNGREGAAMMESSSYDLVVSDYNMPEMDGQQLIQHIRQNSWQSSVPVLMVTSERDQGRLAAVESLGVVGVCDKPFEPATVRNLLRQLLAA